MAKPSATVSFPEELNTMEPITIKDESLLVSAAFVGRYAIDSLPDAWRKVGIHGVYVLLSELRPDYSFEVYVGQTNALFERRLFSHDEKKDFWREAILFARLEPVDSLTSTQVNWLEGEIVQLLKQGKHIKVHNKAWTGDSSLPESNEDFMERVTLFIMRVLFLKGYRSESLGEEVTKLEAGINTNQGYTRNRYQRNYQSNTDKPTLNSPAKSNLSTNTKKFPAASSQPEQDYIEGNLWETLRRWRWRVKGESGLYKPYLVFTDAELGEISSASPSFVKDLSSIPGCTEAKIARYGESLINTLTYFAIKEAARDKVEVIEVKQKKPWWK